MKRMMAVMAAGLVLIGSVQAADAVAPANCTFTNFRGEAEGYVSGTYFFTGSTLRFTNCITYAGADTNSAVQGLSGVTVQVKIGTTTTNTAYTATVTSAALGQWMCDVQIPTNVTSTLYMQLKLTDSSTNSYIYPWKFVNVKTAL